ncbi:uncharacterized protein SCHCODRAFT_02681702 [Schizophyllum commune H4-8]|uniref:Expressed protein n=1 Tax=Schizophyllum commune (strain H4-8 / FGSC 9210) TaxID=578458 RepID=D8QK12_SCHCM|nr:uncharacterized protein SCHCODRAFT_02681702 [Schizophyllum commune H4-8]KAI5885652.1 hypothetical protein SCHCODRAFT_02681702 [Schizophyllum commune H4-8]
MRFSLAPTFLASLLLVFSPATATTTNVKSKTSRIVASRQHSIPRTLVNRDLIDICASVDVSAVLHLLPPLVDIPSLDGKICLCIDDLDIFLSTYIDATVLLTILKGPLKAALALLINTDPTRAHCPPVPPHASRVCKVDDPCGIQCDKGYTRHGNICCPPSGCPSAALTRPNKRRLSSRVTTYEEAQKTCRPRESVCGIAGHEGTLDFECVDTTSTLDSCGGCVTPHGFPAAAIQSSGVDCAALPNVVEVGCKASKCVVNRCKESFVPSSDGSRCISIAAKRQLDLGSLGSTDVDSTTTLDSSLTSDLYAAIDLVVRLGDAHSQTTTPSDVDDLIDATLKATGALLGSNTVSGLVDATNDLLAKTNAAVAGLTSCNCADNLLDLLLKIVVQLNIVLGDMHKGPVTSPAPPGTSPSNPSPVKTPDGGDIMLDLDHLLTELGLGSLLDVGTIDIQGLGPGLSALVQGLLNALDLGPAVPTSGSGAKGTSGTDVNAVIDSDVQANITAIVDIVLKLGGAGSLTGGSSSSGSIDPLVQVLLNVTADLLASSTLTDLVVNLNNLGHAAHILSKAGIACSCLTTNVDKLIADLVSLLDYTLAYVDTHTITTPPAGGSGSSGSSGTGMPTTTGDGGQILVDLKTLLKALGLDGLLDVGTIQVDGLGPELSALSQQLVNGLDLGPQ